MNKFTALLAAALVAATTVITGCEKDETALLAAANTAGNIAVSAWFAIQEPDGQVKTVLKDVVTLTVSASGKIGEGESYVNALTPVVQEVIAKHDELTPAQKNLINLGSSVILSNIDVFIDSKPELKGNAELVSRCVAEFGKGCLIAIERSENTLAAQSLHYAHAMGRLSFDAKTKSFTRK